MNRRWKIVQSRMIALGQWRRPLWLGDDGSLRCGRGDMAQMLIDLGIPERL